MKKGEKCVVLNWKTYLSIPDSVEMSRYVVDNYRDFAGRIIIAPMHLALHEVSRVIERKFALCAQNFDSDLGPHTGGIPIQVMKDLGCTYAIIGHSEVRYREAGEDNDVIGIKVATCVKWGLTPIICFGEKLDERLVDETEDVIEDQIDSAISQIGNVSSSHKFIFAYEPVWALSYSKEKREIDVKEVEKAIQFAKRLLRTRKFGAKTEFFYGGSVNPSNITAFFASKEVDGVLVGKASTSRDTIDEIIERIKP